MVVMATMALNVKKGASSPVMGTTTATMSNHDGHHDGHHHSDHYGHHGHHDAGRHRQRAALESELAHWSGGPKDYTAVENRRVPRHDPVHA